MKIILAAASFLLLTTGGLAFGENSTKIEGHTIHHNAINTDVLTPDIARHYGIIRSRTRAMLNVSVIRDEEGTTGKAVPADVRAYATNLYGQHRNLPLREVREGEAIYYIGDFLVRNQDRLNFHIDVRPEGASQFYPATFSQQFFTESPE